MKFDMHCHTKEGSMDGKVMIEEYIKKLKRKGIRRDAGVWSQLLWRLPEWRDSIKGKNHTDFVVLKGVEYDTIDCGHMLVIMPEEWSWNFLNCAVCRLRFWSWWYTNTEELSDRRIHTEKNTSVWSKLRREGSFTKNVWKVWWNSSTLWKFSMHANQKKWTKRPENWQESIINQDLGKRCPQTGMYRNGVHQTAG